MSIAPHGRPNASFRAVFALLLTVVALPSTAGFTGTDVFIPASARQAGVSPSQFYSTLWLTNLSLGSVANVELQFFQRDTSNTAPITVPMAVAPGQTQKFENVVQTLFGLPSASGAIRIQSDQEILATSRTYDLPPGADIRDANGLFFAGIPQSLSIGIGESTQLQGVSQGGAEDFRYNFGFVETAGSPVTVRINVRNSDGSLIATKDYPGQAYEAKQFAITDAAPGISAVNARIDASVVSGSGRVLVYGTAVANGSQDSIGFEMSFRNALLSGGVTSLNGLAGAVSLAAGANVTLTPGGNTITISASGSGGGGVPSVNGITGPVTLLAGTNISITPAGGNLTIAASSGGGLTLPFTGSAATSSSTGAFNVSTPGTSSFSRAIVGTVSSTSPGDSSTGVQGVNLGTGSLGIGVSGSQAGGGWGVYGQANGTGGIGVYGNNTTGIGVYGTSTSNVGTKGKSTSYNGVWAESTNQDGLYASGGRDGAFMTGARYGAFGMTSSVSAGVDYAGVVGFDGTGVTWSGSGALSGLAGVYGYGRSGVAGVTSAAGSWGVIGMKLNSPTSLGAFGVLGYSTYGVYSFGNMGASGTKPFVEPHPTDPTKVIRYVALEGPEAGTYFRGKAVVKDGVATIEVPESFRIVTDTEGLTVHVTAVGRASQTWVESADLNRIVIGATPDVQINYIVHGVRKAYKDWQVIANNVEYVPMSPTATMPAVLSDEAKRRLIANGTYNPDGTVNMSTAEHLGWARVWREQEQAQAKAEPPK
jgi:hypothetical protein